MKLKQLSAKWFSLALLMGAVALTGCSEKDEDVIPTNPILELGASTLEFSYETETKSVDFESNYSWTALKPSDARWVQILPSDAGSSTDGITQLQFVVDVNTAATDRQAVIRFVHDKGNTETSIVIKQSAFILHPEQYKDSLALVKLYNDCKGYGWSDAWDLEVPFEEWYGVTTDLINGQKRVTEIDLVNRGVSGALPEQLTDLTELKKFVIYSATINTTFPAWFSKMPKLTFLALPACGLTGELPEEIYEMSQLTRLDLWENLELGGTISSKIGQLTNLEVLDWRTCAFTGAIPSEIGNLTKLKSIYLLNNQFSGSIPSSIGNLTELTTIILSNNKLTGSIPTTIGNLKNLEVFDVNENDMSGTLPTELGDCPQLWDLRGMNNAFSGEIPAEIGALPNLMIFTMNGNQLSGSIPETFAANTELVHLVVKDNQLTGTIDSRFSKLETLALSDNDFEGEIPQEIFLSYTMEELGLGGNTKLYGEVPSTFFSRGNFINVNLNGIKELEGMFPEDLTNMYMSNFDIGGCSFSGTIPSDIFLVKDLVTLDLSENNFEGNIPVTAKSATLLHSFRVNGNRLTGEIDPIIKTHENWNSWNAHQFICPQQEGYGLTGCQ
ncbi:MAG: BACON domain-containing protein [Bacteroidales bacterium]